MFQDSQAVGQWQSFSRLLIASAGAFVMLFGAVTAGASECKLIRIAEWPVRIVNNSLFVNGAINGQPVYVLIDTGATQSFIARSAARRLGLPLLETQAMATGVGGVARVGIAHLEEFRVGDTMRRNWQVTAVGEQDLGSVAFALGWDFLGQADVEFDLVNSAIRLHVAKDCRKGVSLAYWARDGAGEARIGWDSWDRRVALTVRINGETVRALLDSGASISLVDLRYAARIGVTPQMPGAVAARPVLGISGTRNTWVAPFQSFQIGDEIITNPRIHIAELPSDRQMILGADFLRAHRVLISNSQSKLFFTYSGGPVFWSEPPPGAPTVPAAPQDEPR